MIINIWAFVILLFTAGFLAGVAIYITFTPKAKKSEFSSFSCAIKPKKPKNKGFKLHIPRGLPPDCVENFLRAELPRVPEKKWETQENEVMAFISNVKNELFGDKMTFDKLATNPNSPKSCGSSTIGCNSISRIENCHSQESSFRKMTDLKDFYRLLEKIN